VTNTFLCRPTSRHPVQMFSQGIAHRAGPSSQHLTPRRVQPLHIARSQAHGTKLTQNSPHFCKQEDHLKVPAAGYSRLASDLNSCRPPPVDGAPARLWVMGSQNLQAFAINFNRFDCCCSYHTAGVKNDGNIYAGTSYNQHNCCLTQSCCSMHMTNVTKTAG